MTSAAAPMPTDSVGTDIASDTQMIVDPRFTGVAATFFSMFRRVKQGGGALSVYWHGSPVIDIWAGWAEPGRRWQSDTMALSYSTSKGMASTVLHRLADRGLVDYDTRVAEYWPEFAAAGKDRMTVRDVMAHRAGLQNMRNLPISLDDMHNHDAVAAAAAKATPDPLRLKASGYHALNYGTLVAEICQRAAGRPFRELVHDELAVPLGENGFYYGVPSDERKRLAHLAPPLTVLKLPAEPLISLGNRIRWLDPGLGTLHPGITGLTQELERPYDAMMPSWNGTFTARALGRAYGALANGGEVHGSTFLSRGTVNQITAMRPNSNWDYVLGVGPHWSLGYHRVPTKPTLPIGPEAFGHLGAGGSGGFAVPHLGMSVGFVTNHIGGKTSTLGDTRILRLGLRAAQNVRNVDGATRRR